jgi:hypothetical protein
VKKWGILGGFGGKSCELGLMVPVPENRTRDILITKHILNLFEYINQLLTMLTTLSVEKMTATLEPFLCGVAFNG